METSKMRVFVAIAKTESVRKAAELTHLTPSAVSKILHQVQEELNTTLLTPMGRGLTLTPEGRRFAQEAERIIKELDDLKRTISSDCRKKRDAPLRIATFEVFSTYFLQTLEETGLNRNNLVLHETLPGELERAVASGKADLGITYMPVPYPEVEHLKVTRIEMGTFKKRDCFGNFTLENLPYVVPVMPLQGTPTRHHGLDGWPADAFTRKVAHEVTLMESALELCRQGVCAGYFPSFIIQLHNKKYRPQFSLVRHKIPGPGEACFTDVFVVKRKDMIEDRRIKQMTRLVRIGTKVPAGFGG